MQDYQSRVEELTQKLDQATQLVELDILAGIDYICRVLFGLIQEMSDTRWQSQSQISRSSISFAYSEMARQAEHIYDSIGRPAEYHGRGRSNETDKLMHDSGLVQALASSGTLIIENQKKRLDPHVLLLLVHACLEAFSSVQEILDVIPLKKEDYYKNNVRDGLNSLERGMILG